MNNAVRNRMKSVRNIQKITKAMKMVAASKLRAVQTRTENSRGLWQPFTALLGDDPSMFRDPIIIIVVVVVVVIYFGILIHVKLLHWNFFMN